MATEYPLWGEERIANELQLKLGLRVSPRTLHKHMPQRPPVCSANIATQDTTCGDQKLPAKVYSTAVYVRQDGKWRSTSYQETALE